MEKYFIKALRSSKKTQLTRVGLAIMFFICSLSLGAQLKLNVSNKPIKNVLEIIERESEYTFLHNADLLDLDKSVSISVTNASIDAVMDKLLVNTNITYKKENGSIVLVLKTPSSPQNDKTTNDKSKVVKGLIIDTAGDPLIGVSIKLLGSKIGTVTDYDGKFDIKVTGDAAKLEAVYVGYTRLTVDVGNQTELKITMEESSIELDAVVVTALGLKREQKALGYAITELKGEDLYANAINPISALQGKVAGVEIAGTDGGLFGSTKILIRGSSTLSNNNQPIYVIDGVILDNKTYRMETDYAENQSSNDYGNELKNLNPDDFETVSVLRGAAATALYGSRALNGAVVITTKSGGSQKGLGISVNQTIGFDKVFKTADLQKEYGPGALSGGVGYGEQYLDENGTKAYYRWDNAGQFRLNAAGKPTIIKQPQRGWGPRYDGREIEGYDHEYMAYTPFKNSLMDAYKTGINTNTNLTIKGGNDKTTFYSSLSYRYANGTLENNSFSRLSYLIKASHKLSDRITVSGSVNFANSRPKNVQPAIGTYFATGALNPLYDAKYYQKNYKGDEHGGMANSNYGDKFGEAPQKDLWWNLYENNDNRLETVIRPTFDVDVKILDWVSARGEANMNYYITRRERKNLGSGHLNYGGSYLLSETEKRQETFAGSLIFNKALNDFNVGGFARAEYFNTMETWVESSTSEGLIAPGKFYMKNSRGPVKGDGKVSDEKRMVSGIFAANVSYKNQYYLDVTGRNDWSSALVYVDGTGNNSYFYPSVSGSWLASETFKEQLPSWVSFAKFRASWAQVGNDTDPYSINPGYSMANVLQLGGSTILTMQLPDTMYERDLKPERKTSYEFGIDWRFVDSRVNLDLTYYRENTRDQIMDIPLPGETGMKNKKINAGNIQNEGIEVTLNTIPFRNKDWEWTLDFTYTKNKNKIISLHENVQSHITLSGSTYGDTNVEAVAKIGGFYGLLLTNALPERDEKGNIVLTWEEVYRVAYPKINKETQELGKSTPDFLGSLSTGVTFKGLTLRGSLDCRYGGYIASYSNRYGITYGHTETSLAYRNPERGGITWTSDYKDSKGQTFSDGMIPEGVFADGTKVDSRDGKSKIDVGGMTFREAYEQGLVEPVHASAYHTRANGWGNGTVNDNWVSKVKYIALREVSLSYRVPRAFASKLGAKGLNLSATGRNLGYLYNSLPNNLNPESVRGNGAADFRERSFSPYTASYVMTVGLDF